ncbi:PH domain-containing protein [uncultured Amnibacterium sp.]|uniref:PH domain-containing protein n=1 Tax=uncultured Amnibacterium sp. TaxID=1631851 RepID=UPI0035CC459F
MSDTAPATGGRVTASSYLDGEWHRLHPATPLLRGGILILALLTYLAARERDQVFNLVFHLGDQDDGDPVSALQRHGLVGAASLVLLGVVLIAVVGFWLSWRTSEFRIADGHVTARHGILLRTTRTARLDRVQGVTIGRPLLARLLGAARIELDVAGQNANVRLEYLSYAAAESLRLDVLHLASGLRHPTVGSDEPAARIEDEPGVGLLAIGPARAIGAVLLSESTVVLLLVLFVGIPVLVAFTSPAAAVSILPVLIGSVTVAARRIGRNLRYTIVGTTDGVRVGAGLLSTSNEAVPPGRVHAIRIEQPLLWRPAGWWRVAVNRAGRIQGRRNNDLERAIAPIAKRAEVQALLPYLIPDLTERMELIEQGLTGSKAGEFVPAPGRAAWLRPFAWRRTGFALTGGALLMRGGWLHRHLTLVPQARVQSVSLQQGPAGRLLGVATVEVHTVHGQIHGRMELVDAERAVRLFRELAEAGQRAREVDRAHRWNAHRSDAPRVAASPGPAPA